MTAPIPFSVVETEPILQAPASLIKTRSLLTPAGFKCFYKRDCVYPCDIKNAKWTSKRFPFDCGYEQWQEGITNPYYSPDIEWYQVEENPETEYKTQIYDPYMKQWVVPGVP